MESRFLLEHKTRAGSSPHLPIRKHVIRHINCGCETPAGQGVRNNLNDEAANEVK